MNGLTAGMGEDEESEGKEEGEEQANAGPGERKADSWEPRTVYMASVEMG